MAGQGTGQPLAFACASCRRRAGGIGGMLGWRKAVFRTGRTRKAKKTPGLRMLDQSYEYHCRTCGHTGWTRHRDIPGVSLGDDHKIWSDT